MDKGRLSISPAAVLLGALLYCTASFSELAAILAPVIVHELGHVVALRLYGLRVRRITADLRGLCIEYSGLCAPLGHAVSALAGPVAGLGYAFAASYYSRGGSNEVLTLSAGVVPCPGTRFVTPLNLPYMLRRVGSLSTGWLAGESRFQHLDPALDCYRRKKATCSLSQQSPTFLAPGMRAWGIVLG